MRHLVFASFFLGGALIAAWRPQALIEVISNAPSHRHFRRQDAPSPNMTRYLTPWRISLLCLITVYTDGAVPNSSAIHVLSFLTSGLFPLDPADKQWEKHYLPSITELEEVLSGHQSSVPGRTLWDLFLKKIWSLDSLDALEEFFSDVLPSLLSKTREQLMQDRDNGLAPEDEGMRLSRSSPLGAFVRRAYLEYTRLQFHDSVKLWSGFVKYRLPTYHMWARRNPYHEQAPIDVNLLESNSYLSQVVYGNIEDDEEEEGVVSVKDAERLVEFQVGELQSRSLLALLFAFAWLTITGLGGRVPDEMRTQLKHIMTSESSVPVLMYYLE
jgi:anaphase-promoting complex subunit 5